MQEYYSFATRFTLGFGLAFELPVVVLALVRFGLVTYKFMARTRPYAIVLIFILATIITPTPDILTLIAMGLPMCLLYESCIWIAWFMQRRSGVDRRPNPVDDSAYQTLFSVFAFVLGAVVGSFLNVCIYRLPLDLSVNEPRRSFCPACKKPIPWHQNLPLISWLVLRGRCANCGNKIAFRYFAVELLTALLFLAIWQAFPWQIAIAYWVFVSLVIAATFIDFEHFIIPDQITIGGAIAGIIASVLVPGLMNTHSRVAALVPLGPWRRPWLSPFSGSFWKPAKIAFGKKRIRLDAPTPFTWKRHVDDADFVVGEERSLWSDHFARESDRLLLYCNEAKIDDRNLRRITLEFHYNRVKVEGDTLELDQVERNFRRGTRTPDSARSDGPRRPEISRRDRRLPRLARRFVQSFWRIARRIAGRSGNARARETRLVGEAAVRSLSRLRRAGLDVFRRRVAPLVYGIV